MKNTKLRPQPGDSVVFYYARTDCDDPGFYGWGVVLQWIEQKDAEHDHTMHFRPVAPSDQLKIRPWWDETEVQRMVDEIRPANRGTLFPVNEKNASDIGAGIARWVGGHGAITQPQA